jgi:hypothetical protein
LRKKFHRKEVVAAFQAGFNVMVQADDESLKKLRQNFGPDYDTTELRSRLLKARMGLVILMAGPFGIAPDEIFPP